jgi:hypothetical protein
MAGAIGGILIGNNIGRLQAGIAAATVAWKALEKRGLTLGSEPVTGLATASGKSRPVLTGPSCSVRIVSDFVHYAHTKIIAVPANGADATVGVHPNPAGLLGWIRQRLGQDIQIGDAAFDEAFLITGQPETAAKALLTAPRRAQIVTLAASHLAGFTYAKGEVVVLLVGVVTDDAVLGTAIDLACEAATFRG